MVSFIADLVYGIMVPPFPEDIDDETDEDRAWRKLIAEVQEYNASPPKLPVDVWKGGEGDDWIMIICTGVGDQVDLASDDGNIKCLGPRLSTPVTGRQCLFDLLNRYQLKATPCWWLANTIH